MEDKKELKDLSVIELKAAAYERVVANSQIQAELNAIQQELAKRQGELKAEKA